MRQASFVFATHDRVASNRNNPAWLASERANPLNRLIAFVEERPLLRIIEATAELVTIGVDAHQGELVLIGRDDRHRLLFAAEIDRASPPAPPPPSTCAALPFRVSCPSPSWRSWRRREAFSAGMQGTAFAPIAAPAA